MESLRDLILHEIGKQVTSNTTTTYLIGVDIHSIGINFLTTCFHLPFCRSYVLY